MLQQQPPSALSTLCQATPWEHIPSVKIYGITPCLCCSTVYSLTLTYLDPGAIFLSFYANAHLNDPVLLRPASHLLFSSTAAVGDDIETVRIMKARHETT